jgi:hypothetical protein
VGISYEDACDDVCKEILYIEEEYRRQEETGYIDTPGGLEHMGDVWKQIHEWANSLNAAKKAASNG